MRDLHLAVEEGEIFGFLDPNGAGKTTTQQMLTTLLPPDSDQALVAGYDLLRQPQRVRTRIGYVSQKGGSDGAATGRENLLLQAQFYGLRRKEAQVCVSELSVELDLTPFVDRIAYSYSGGQRRRLDLALGLVHRPPLLFLDEPGIGLDPHSRSVLLCAGSKPQRGNGCFVST